MLVGIMVLYLLASITGIIKNGEELITGLKLL